MIPIRLVSVVMSARDHRYRFASDPKPNPKNVFQGKNYRLTLLGEATLRYEWSDSGEFEDRASTFALFRNQPAVEHTLTETEQSITISTKKLHIFYKKDEPFSGATFNVAQKTFSNGGGKWFYGGGKEPDRFNLGGTARTLDEANGRIPLEHGLLSVQGWALIDDSDSQVFDESGWMVQRSPAAGRREDAYLFAHGDKYAEAVKDFYAISGKEPLLPRWAFGNWWSRYYAVSNL